MAANWRDKYLQVLAEQESSDKRSAKQLLHLKDCLEAMATAAIGLDPELDDVLLPIASQKSKRSTRQVSSDQIIKAAKKVSDRKATRETVSRESFQSIAKTLVALNPDGELTRKLKGYKRLLPRRVKNLHAYPQLLQEISELQDLVLRNVIAKQPGALAKLFGASPSFATSSDIPAMGVPAEEAYIDGDEVAAEGEAEAPKVDRVVAVEALETLGATGSASGSKPGNEPDLEPGYGSIQAKLLYILQEMIEASGVEGQLLNHIEQAKERLELGLNWYEMIATLEHVRNLFSGALLNANAEFTDYLKGIDSALLHLKHGWLELIEGQQLQVESQKEVKKTLASQEAQLLVEMDQAADLNALKASVTTHVSSLTNAIGMVDGLESRAQEASRAMLAMQAEFKELQAKNQALHQELAQQKHQATHDALTGLPNRGAFNQRVEEEFARWQRYNRPLVMAVVDIDHFKHFNDSFGHQAGDRVLKIIAKLLQENVREVDFVARFGGEEFVILLPETTSIAALGLLDKLRELLLGSKYKFKDEPVTITASFGFTEFKQDDSPEAAFERADQALYKAKQSGRNRVLAL